MTELSELRTTIIRISLISHAPVQQYDSDGGAHDTSEDIGGKRPPGTDQDRPRHPGPNADPKRLAEYRDDYAAWLSSYQRKTPAYFVERLGTNPSDQRVTELLAEAKSVLDAWRTHPHVAGQDPESMADPRWKRWVAASTLDSGDLARRFGCTRRYINKIKAMDWSAREDDRAA